MPNTLLTRLRDTTGRRLLVAAIACNAALVPAARADAPASRPASTLSPATHPSAVVDVRRTVEYLASDELEGRGSGTVAQDKAAEYIADVFATLKLERPAGWDGYFQPFKLTTGMSVDPATNLSAGDGANWVEAVGRPVLESTKDFIPLPVSRDGRVDAGVVFAGYGISDKDLGYDDYAGIDVKGKVVLVLRFEPVDDEGRSKFSGRKDDWSNNATFARKLSLATERGAAAMLVVNPPNWVKEDPLLEFAGAARNDRAGLPAIQVIRPVADAMLKAGGLKPLAELQKAIDGAKAPRSQPLAGVTVRANVVLKPAQKDVRNVAAVLPGKGPRADEFVVVGAHYDHLGRGGPGAFPIFAGQIHHGADDNASGTAAMLKLAELFAAAGPQERSILFVAFTAEEWGLNGSKYFVGNPPVPLAKMAAMVNLDMVGRVRENRLEVGGSGTAPSLDRILAEASAGLPLKLSTNSKGGLGPSDHMSFGLKKVPVLFFFSGVHLDYHRPTDTADKVNYDGIESVVTLGQRVVTALTKAEKEQYVGKFDSTGIFGMMSGGGPTTNPAAGSPSRSTGASLGVIPDYDEGVNGVRISGASEGSPAARAGLQAKDTLVGWNGKPISNINDLMARLTEGKPGDQVKVKVLRDGKEVELDATLGERRR